MGQGRQALCALLEGVVSWPPVVVPFGLDPFGWHGEQESYGDVCAFALEHCTLLPKVSPFSNPLVIGAGDVEVISDIQVESDGTLVRRSELTGANRILFMEEVQTKGDASWKIRKRWIENDDDLDFFLALAGLAAAEPDIAAVRGKERQVGRHGLPYVEVADPFLTVCEMLPTETFFVKTRTDIERIDSLLERTGSRIVCSIEALCRDAGCPFILRLIGAEMAVPPFMSREDFLSFEGGFYRQVAAIAHRFGIPAAFHCHGPVRDILDDVWDMGYDMIEPFEPPPRGNISIAEALFKTRGRGIVFGGVDEVVFSAGEPREVREAVQRCLNEAVGSNGPYILSQTATPFYDPLGDAAKENLLLFMELGTLGSTSAS